MFVYSSNSFERKKSTLNSKCDCIMTTILLVLQKCRGLRGLRSFRGLRDFIGLTKLEKFLDVRYVKTTKITNFSPKIHVCIFE